MRELWVWRVIATVALIGWAATAVALWPSEAPPPPTAPEVASVPERPDVGPERRRRRVLRDDAGPNRGREPVPMARAEAPKASGEISEEVLEVARQQVREEWRARREAGAEERLDRSLQQIATFVQDHQLDDDTHVALEAAVTDMHSRMRELFANRDWSQEEDEATRDARREQFRANFDKLETDVVGVLGEELGETFLEDLRGDGPGPGGRGPRFR